MDLEKEIEELIKKSLEDKQFTDSIFFDLPLITQLELKKILFKNFDGYKCEINSHDIRHTNKNHSEDIHFISKIPDIISNFTEIKKSFVEDKKTKKTIYAIEFYKKYDDKTVKAVKIHLRKEKILRLKTLFIPKK
ncbi:hypothetical protein N5S76_07715 [Aliarcobacter cryaerophilus]|uniref:PBECR3 domain-containing polyvalent protein n=1 Tax=Aliarcobacter cryaerophilus TaxID=28198 RepID=UPI0021B6B95A|nr:hypothetical protein [Aliarcobacter cryaerophilus]MCT7499657.1 hypothetical protein [Aliarcobacter cryaerophilus]MCT7517606.1 hypothetical protein [Aliarcobacter cryaerophilus]